MRLHTNYRQHGLIRCLQRQLLQRSFPLITLKFLHHLSPLDFLLKNFFRYQGCIFYMMKIVILLCNNYYYADTNNYYVNGQDVVKASPNNYGLYSQAQYDASYNAGKAAGDIKHNVTISFGIYEPNNSNNTCRIAVYVNGVMKSYSSHRYWDCSCSNLARELPPSFTVTF